MMGGKDAAILAISRLDVDSGSIGSTELGSLTDSWGFMGSVVVGAAVVAVGEPPTPVVMVDAVAMPGGAPPLGPKRGLANAEDPMIGWGAPDWGE